MTIYADVLITINFIIDLMLLRMCVLLTGIPLSTRRRYGAALVGAVGSLVIFLPVRSFGADLMVRMVLAAAVIAAAYGRRPPRVFFRLLLVFYGVSFLTAGAVLALWMVLPPGMVAVGNGAIYFHIRPLLLVGSVIAAYGFVSAFNGIFRQGDQGGKVYTFTVKRMERVVSFPALADTGNRLTEPFSGLPVVVVSLTAAAALLTPEEEAYILREGLDGTLPPGLRVVGCSTVAGEKMLVAFRPDSMTVKTKAGEEEIQGYVAVSSHEIGDGTYSGVFHPQVIQILT